MKKKIVFLLIIFILVGCSKTSINLDDFIETAHMDGYIITSDIKSYEKYSYIKSVYYATSPEESYRIQFLEIENNDYAKKFFDYNKNEMEKFKTNNSYLKTKNISDYNLYHLETDDDYLLIIRSNNNIIYIETSIDYINEIEEFLNDLKLEY